jgi:arylsulfatase A-like enzyme
MKRLLLPLLLSIGLCPRVSLAVQDQGAKQPSKQPNILFFISDDQFKEMMNFLPEGKGKNLTPNTDRFSSEGTVMLRQYVTSPVCTPSRFACLTGKYPSRSTAKPFLNGINEANGQTVVQWNTFITTGQVCLPMMLRDAGYFTGIVGKNHVFEAPGWRQPKWTADPFAKETKEQLAHNEKVQEEAAKLIGFDFAASLYYNNPNENGIKALASHNLDWIGKGALDFFDKLPADEPFYLYLATTVPHGPQEAGRSWDADRRITPEGMLDAPVEVLPPRATIPQRLQAAGIKGHQKENVLWLDDLFGAVVKKLEQLGRLDNTIIVYFNDHGQKSKGTVYEGGVHGESFYWRKGGFPVGQTCSVPVSNIDFAPTILDLAGVKYDPKEFDGQSVVPVLNGEKAAERPLFFELGYVRGVLKDNWKYIALRYPKSVMEMTREQRQAALDKFNEEQQKKGRPIYTQDPMQAFSHVSPIPGGGDAEHLSMGAYPAFYEADQLYNLSDDPKEQKNLVGDHGYEEKLNEMKDLLKAHLETLPGSFGELKP